MSADNEEQNALMTNVVSYEDYVSKRMNKMTMEAPPGYSVPSPGSGKVSPRMFAAKGGIPSASEAAARQLGFNTGLLPLGLLSTL